MRAPNGSGDTRRPPSTPSPERARLTAALRGLKERAGLSLTGLEERTPFSKSSWGRSLKGETLPPRDAVRELCRLAGEPDAHCLALWELAESESSGRAAPAPAPPRCQGTACEGRDPVNMLCGIPLDTLLEHRTASGADLQVRCSPKCGTSWGRVRGTRVGDRVELTAAGPPRSAEIADALDAKAYVYTPMTRKAPGTLVRACFHPAGQTRREECFEATVR
ncbi:helix-turn-helix domain-containing protein [Streptomyces hirsutus]|uniref:helix-turn-helix domain-containing protein n=1 Tax=Streptomyces hirsutus TaxID=35620 RepID=UPI0033D1F83F